MGERVGAVVGEFVGARVGARVGGSVGVGVPHVVSVVPVVVVFVPVPHVISMLLHEAWPLQSTVQVPVPHFIFMPSHEAWPLQSTVQVPESHCIVSPLHAFLPRQSTMQVPEPEQGTCKFSQAKSTLQSTVQVPEQGTCTSLQALVSLTREQRTTIFAVAATVMTHSCDPFSVFISMRHCAFAAHVTLLLLRASFTTFAQQLVMPPGGFTEHSANANFPLPSIHVAAEE